MKLVYSAHFLSPKASKLTRSPPNRHACGENPSSYNSVTRLDTGWAFRHAYNEARKIKEGQDAYCEKAAAGRWDSIGPNIPESLEWEALVDVLRGRVKVSYKAFSRAHFDTSLMRVFKVNVHCYEAIDLDGIVRLSNEFQFPIAAFHHAHEAYLVPNLLKRTYGGTPAVALFTTLARYCTFPLQCPLSWISHS